MRKDGIGWIDVEPNPLVFSPTTFTVSGSQLLATAHGRATGDGPVRFTTTGGLPSPLAPATDYWLVVVDPNTLLVAATFEDAIAAKA